jgi:hypothetical protein
MAAFEVVPEEVAQQNPSPQSTNAQKILLFALGELNKKFVVAISNLFSLFGLASVWLLCDKILEEPSTQKLIGVGIYCLFLLMLEGIRRKGK